MITGTRAEYGLLTPLLRLLDADGKYDLRIVALAGHFVPGLGSTYREIEADGFDIAERLETQLATDTAQGTVKSMGVELISLADALDRLSPDLVILLGDRSEILAAATAAHVMQFQTRLTSMEGS